MTATPSDNTSVVNAITAVGVPYVWQRQPMIKPISRAKSLRTVARRFIVTPFCFRNTRGDQIGHIVVSKVRKAGVFAAHAVPCKGTGRSLIVQQTFEI